MEQNEITEGNKAIAEIMGYQVTEDGWIINGQWPNMCEMIFHASWDALIPVCIKCEEVLYNYSGKRPGGFELSKLHSAIKYAVSTYELEAVYSAVIQFLTYHNKTKENGTN